MILQGKFDIYFDSEGQPFSIDMVINPEQGKVCGLCLGEINQTAINALWESIGPHAQEEVLKRIAREEAREYTEIKGMAAGELRIR